MPVVPEPAAIREKDTSETPSPATTENKEISTQAESTQPQQPKQKTADEPKQAAPAAAEKQQVAEKPAKTESPKPAEAKSQSGDASKGRLLPWEPTAAPAEPPRPKSDDDNVTEA